MEAAKILTIPALPGVYLMKDRAGNVIYIGKAKSLKKRLAAYFKDGLSPKTAILMLHAEDIEYRLCPTEALALLLEARLIKQYKPKYNVSLRDDKSFPFVKITDEEFPAVYITRERERGGSLYLGPYTSAKLLKAALKIIRRYFPYRSCLVLPRKACIYYRLGLSPAPCIGRISKEEYAKAIENIRLILEGRVDSLIKMLTEEMNLKAGLRKFEEAAKARDQIEALSVMARNSSGGLTRKDELSGLKEIARLKKIPERIEAFDISNISGKEAAGSMVSFFNGSPDKNNYRRFRVKTVRTIDDYKMLAEVLRRRYLRLKDENSAFPDLVLIDGGKQHLLTAQKELEKLGLNIPLVSIAKGQENIYIKGSLRPVKLDADTSALNLIRRLRDEAHRFALKYHHVLRKKKMLGE